MEPLKTDVTLTECKQICREADAYFTRLAWSEDPLSPGPAIKAMILLRALRSAIEQWEYLISHDCKNPVGKS